MQTFHKVIHTPFQNECVFRVPTETRGDVYMRVMRSNYCNDERTVVEVDAQKFLELWRGQHSSHFEIAHGTPSTWLNDYKYADAENGFLRGEASPVPLAEVDYQVWSIKRPIWRRRYWLFKVIEGYEFLPRQGLGFTNGITRTIWLLTAGAKVFPVECRTRSAHLLQKLAGLPGGEACTVEELLPQKRWDEFLSA